MTHPRFDNEFVADCMQIIRKKTQGKVVSRRRFLGALSVLGVLPVGLQMKPVHAASDEIVVINWGGDALTTYGKAWVEPFNAASDTQAVLEGAGPTSGRIKAMVESGAVVWDVCDRNLPASIDLGRQDLLEKVDWDIVDADKLREHHRSDWGVGSYLYSFVLTWDSKAHPEAPRNWADFWNVKDFPGTRTLRNDIEGMLEAALMADGVAPEDVYPIDVERAFEKIREIKEHTIFWSNGAESQELFRDGAVTMGNLWNTRSMMLREETDGRIQFDFNQGVLFAGAWIVPKNNPAGSKAWEFVASTQDPAQQAELFTLSGNGPTNPDASELVPEELRVLDPGNPDNLAKQLVTDAMWYADYYRDILNQYTDLITS